MSDRAREFVAEELWLATAIVTFGLAATIPIAFPGSTVLVPLIPVVGWFLLTPLFYFWGEDIAALLYGEETPETPPDPLEALKGRYARGEIDEEAFERRLEKLVALDDLPQEVVTDVSAGDVDVTEDELERELERDRN